MAWVDLSQSVIFLKPEVAPNDPVRRRGHGGVGGSEEEDEHPYPWSQFLPPPLPSSVLLSISSSSPLSVLLFWHLTAVFVDKSKSRLIAGSRTSPLVSTSICIPIPLTL